MPRRRRQPTNYAEATHGSPWWIVRYAHERRAAVAVEMLSAGRPRIVLDWGTGDGRVLELLLDRPGAPELVLAYEPGEVMRGLLREAKARHPQGDRIVVFGTIAELETFLDGRTVDTIACLGVLEHLPLAPRGEFYEFAHRHVSPGGSILIDVPVEIGPAVLLKEVSRVVLKGRPREYTIGQLMRRTFGRTVRDPERFVDDGSEHFLGWHRDFDHRHLIEEMETCYEVVERRNTPLRFAPSWFFNQEVLFRAHRRAAPASS